MSSSSSNFHPLLPQTKESFSGGSAAGEWHVQSGVSLFNRIGNSIDFGSDAPGEINSIPSPWSRALQMLSAVRNSNYPTRSWLIGQYRGLLATLALAENLRFQVEAREIKLQDFEQNSFAKSLNRLRPLAHDSVFSAATNSDPWSQLFVFILDDKVVGFTSPATLVVPASRLSPLFERKLPWVKQGYFQEPSPFLTPSHKKILAGWLHRLADQTIASSPATQSQDGQDQLAGALATVLLDFSKELVSNTSIVSPQPSTSLVPYLTELSPSLLRNLYPAGIELQDSNVYVLPSTGLSPSVKLYLYDPVQMPASFDRSPQEITVVGSLSLANFSPELGKTVETNSLFWQPLDLFLPELYYTKEAGAFPGSWLTSKLQNTDYSILLPLKSELRDYFTSDDLKQKIDLSTIRTSSGPGIRVTLRLSLSGFDHPVEYSCFRDYPLKPENAITGSIPTLALWPFVPSSNGWKQYYLLAETSEGIDLAFKIEQPTPEAVADSANDIAESYQYWRCQQLPQSLVALGSNGKELGMIPLIQPQRQPSSAGDWVVGVDFGTSLTNVAVRKGSGSPEPLPLKTLLQQITRDTDIQLVALREFFVPSMLLPENQNPPMSTVLTTRGWQYQTSVVPKLIGQARIYVPRLDRFEFDKEYIRTNIKWEQLECQGPFLGQLLRMISAQAALEGVRRIEWRVSYPTAFSQNELDGYRFSWSKLVSELSEVTGQDHQFDPASGVETESIAFAQYCADILNIPLVHTACVDMGGGTSDISIWQNNHLLHQASVPYAGRDFFHRILNPTNRNSNLKYLGGILGLTAADADSLVKNLNGRSSNFNTALDTYLRGNSEDLLAGSYRAASSKSDNTANSHFRHLIAFSVGGLYHYIGTILAGLKQEGSLQSDQATAVLMGGNGSRFLKWLTPSGGFHRDSEAHVLLEAILANASSMRPNPLGIDLTSKPKAEACEGLAVDRSGEKLRGLGNRKDDNLFAGLDFSIQGRGSNGMDSRSFSATSRIRIPKEWDYIEELSVQGYGMLDEYIQNFNSVINDNDIESFSVLQAPSGKKVEHIDERIRSLLDQYVTQQFLRKKGPKKDLEPEPPFLLAMKCLIRILAEDWSQSK